MNKNHRCSFTRNNQAVAGIVVAVMILGLIVSVISIIQTVYIPKWMEEREAEHMSIVADQFAEFKHSIDTLDATNSTTPITLSITLGSKELGFLSSTRAFGHLQLVTNAFKIVCAGTPTDINSFSYASQNAYFLDQTYTFEAGAVILDQADGSVMLYTPQVTVTLNGNDVTLLWSCTDLDAQGGTSSMGGYGSYPLRVSYASRKSIPVLPSISNIVITTSHPALWEDYFDEAFSKAGLTKASSAAAYYSIATSGTPLDTVTIDFTGYAVDLSIFKTVINLQIGPGWV
jgi:hypothetical protein